MPSCDCCCAPVREQHSDGYSHTRWKRPNRRSCCLRLLDFVCDGFGLLSTGKSFYTWHSNQAMIYGWRFVMFQVTVNAVGNWIRCCQTLAQAKYSVETI